MDDEDDGEIVDVAEHNVDVEDAVYALCTAIGDAVDDDEES